MDTTVRDAPRVRMKRDSTTGKYGSFRLKMDDRSHRLPTPQPRTLRR